MGEPDSHPVRGQVERTDEGTISLLDILSVLVKRRWLIICFTGLVALVVTGFLYYTTKAPAATSWNPLPDVFKPTVKVLISSGQGNSLSSMLSQSNLGALSSLIGLAGVSSGGSSADLAQALLKDSNAIKDQIAAEFDFLGKYKITKMPKTAMRGKIQNALDIKFDSRSGILTIGYQDIDPVFATQIVNRVVELLENRFKALTLDKVQRKMQYLEQTIADVETTSDRTTQDLVAFMNKYGILNLSSVVGSGSDQLLPENMKRIAQLQAEVFTKQVDLQLQSDYMPDSDPRIIQLKGEIAQLQKMISDLQAGSKEFSQGPVSTQQLPGVSVQYLTLKRDAEIQQAILSMLKQQYETTKLEESDTAQTFQIVEKAEVPEVKSGPGRSKMAVIAVVCGLFLSVLIAFILEYFDRVRQDPVESEKLTAMKRMIVPRKKGARV